MQRKINERVKILRDKGIFDKKGTLAGATWKMVAAEMLTNLKKFVQDFPEGRNIPFIELFEFLGKPTIKEIPANVRHYLLRNGIVMRINSKRGIYHIEYHDPLREIKL